MVVVVDVPPRQVLGALLLAGPSAGGTELLGQDPVVSGRVRSDALVPRTAQHGGDVAGAIARTVIGHDPLDVGDAVRGEERPRPVGDSDRGGRLLVR